MAKKQTVSPVIPITPIAHTIMYYARWGITVLLAGVALYFLLTNFIAVAFFDLSLLLLILIYREELQQFINRFQ